ncbi:MAG: 1-deoxy-D-xylulose-5-phosphate reductoisomerase, partial [Gemmatimonadetes bacterium]|nr:1-deoxy-D-xylulose-5-phosphate reductoisomerase [Gemmatimonadota bacterium]
SEHSAILQCIGAARRGEVRRIILTASGGPFRQMDRAALEGVDAAMALQHPTWEMGSKISIDSATLANKALEVIEAHFLYGLPYDRIEVVVHPTSIVHSLVEFVDGSVLAQMGEPTMELPILHALAWPRRPPDDVLCTFDPLKASPLVFEPVDTGRFPLFGLGVEAGRAGGASPATFNAANEVAVNAFLEGRVSFTSMADVVAGVLETLQGRSADTLDEILQVDRDARRQAASMIRE